MASLVGHNTVRGQVMGTANRQATPEEIARMQELVENGMRDGAVGFSTGLIYIPGTYSNTRRSGGAGEGRRETRRRLRQPHARRGRASVLEAIDEAVRRGPRSRHAASSSRTSRSTTKRLWGMSEKSLALVEKFRREGVDVVVDQYPYDRSSTNLGITLPSWALADGTRR